MREIKSCVAVVTNPHGADKVGEVAQGRYFLESDWLTLCDEGGTPLRNDDTGARFTQRLEHGDDERQEAKRLTLRFWRENNKDEMAGFRRTIRYPDRGLA